MRKWALLAAIATIAAPAAVEAQSAAAPAALPPALEQCIRDNAAKVEATVPDLGKGVEFLVTGVCAVPLSEERLRVAKVMADKQAARMKTMCDAQKLAVRPPSEDDTDMCSNAFDPDDMVTTMTISGMNAGDAGTPAAKALASQLLLDLRLSHLKMGSSH